MEMRQRTHTHLCTQNTNRYSAKSQHRPRANESTEEAGSAPHDRGRWMERTKKRKGRCESLQFCLHNTQLSMATCITGQARGKRGGRGGGGREGRRVKQRKRGRRVVV